ncbi:hypothetical protein LLS1_28920 [Leifsonia sp. LS1]|uniref:hypothetical protein n=1 Tax=Leifsonia sp. LS1 TaxID=2828483 RepID=UPI001CFF2581|nr:hypothetical protein [Leifsonia sp. LS1]GIT81223.1 hypothetical protein LLS1_28920 [Leifsonia sp. LS1]
MDVTAWLLDGDPAIRWQTRRDLLGEPPSAWAEDRASVERTGWGAALLDAQDPSGTWGGAVWKPEDWDATDDTMLLLATLGAAPDGPRMAEALRRVRQGVDWGEEWGRSPFFEGEVEPCINGRVLVAGAAFGSASERIVGLLLADQKDDGGWNCYSEDHADPGSFHSTICALEGLVAYRGAGGPTDVSAAIARGHAYLLDRALLRRKRDGTLIDEDWLTFRFPTYWRYDVLRGLDHLRAAGVPADDRVAEAVELVAGKRGADGRWLLEAAIPGRTIVTMEQVGEPSRWQTLRALRVLAWAGRPST